jgi:PAS domain S-box-containing protein
MSDRPAGAGSYAGSFSLPWALPRRLLALPTGWRYLAALAVVALAALLRMALEPLWGNQIPFIFFYPAIMLAAWVGGLGPGLAATVVSATLADYLWIEPARSLRIESATDALALATFVVNGSLISALNEAWRRGALRLLAAEERLRVTLGGIGDAVVTTDARGRVTALNAVAQELVGWTEPEAAGRPLSEVFVIVNEETRQAADNPVYKVLREGSVAGLANHTVLLARDGREIPIDDSAAPVRADDGTLLGVVLVFRDITARRQHERERALADRRKDEFLALLGHELRNPLGAIVSAAQLLKQLAPLEGRAAWARGVIERQAGHVARMVDDLLDVSRISRGQIVLRREPVPVSSVVAFAEETTRPLFAARGQTLSSTLPTAPAWVDGDVNRLAQVVGNLLSNASRYSPEGASVSLEVECQAAAVVLSVKDRGVGIAPELLPRLFDAFTQREESPERASAGLGLGLTLARRLTEMHGGTIEARSAGPGLGSEFVVRLPTMTGAPPRPAAPAAVPAPDSVSRRRVLLVDDNTDSGQALQLALQLAGHDVRLAADGPSALAEAARFAPEVAVLDIGLPGMNGFELARRLRDTGSGSLVLVALTGHGLERDRRRGLESGFDHYLVKPVSPDSIMSLLQAPSRA